MPCLVTTTPYQHHGPTLRSQARPFRGSIATAPYSSQQSLNSVFEHEDLSTQHYNEIVSRQLMHSADDSNYAYINEAETGPQAKGTLSSFSLF